MIKNQRGGAAVEFAIVLPLLAIILFGTIDFSLLFYNKQVLTNASREGARSSIVKDNQETSGVPKVTQNDIITNYCANHLITFGGSNSVNTPTILLTTVAGVNYITATVTYDYKHLFGSLDFFNSVFGISKTTTITGKTVMRSE